MRLERRDVAGVGGLAVMLLPVTAALMGRSAAQTAVALSVSSVRNEEFRILYTPVKARSPP